MKAVIIGAGSWGTALASILASKGIFVTLLLRDLTLAQNINTTHYNTKYFPNMLLSTNIIATIDPKEAFIDANIVVYASSFQHARTHVTQLAQYITSDMYYINTSKGIETHTSNTMSQIIEEVLPQSIKNFSVLSGPSFAKEVLEKKYTSIVLANKNMQLAEYLADIFSTPYLLASCSTDIIGVEIAGAVKNIIAIATGFIDAVENSANSRAFIITKGLREIQELGLILGATKDTFMGPAGIGDLLLTSTGELSRNRTVGFMLGKGKKLHTIIESMSATAEGIATSHAIQMLSKKHNIIMPISNAIYHLLHATYTIEQAKEKMFLPIDIKEGIH